MAVASQGVQTMRRLDTVEADRDQWQRPERVLEGLQLKDGGVVVDLGCGAGYFALKLAQTVGRAGRVLAVDTQWSPLLFLKSRAFLRGQHNVSVIHGEPSDPHLSGQVVDAVLIVNTYHELVDRESILNHVLGALKTGGRLVIADRGLEPGEGPGAQSAGHHGMPPASAEADLRRKGLDILTRQDRFADSPSKDQWWLIVASKP